MIAVKAAARLKAAAKQAMSLQDVLAAASEDPIEVGKWERVKVDGADMPYFKAIDAITNDMGDASPLDCQYTPKAFCWKQAEGTVLVIPDDDTASHYYVFTKE